MAAGREERPECRAAARAGIRQLHRSQGAKNARQLEKRVVHSQALLHQAGIDGGRAGPAVLRRKIARPKDRVASQEEDLKELRGGSGKLRSAPATYAGARFGKTSETQGKSGSRGRRGQQVGKPGHGRTRHPQLECRLETRDPPEAERSCSSCGLPHVKNGSHETGSTCIHVKAHARCVHRNRWRRDRACTSSPMEVTAPPPARLLAGIAFGTGFWSLCLFERHACQRPLRRVAEWMQDRGLPVSAGTVVDARRNAGSAGSILAPVSAGRILRLV